MPSCSIKWCRKCTSTSSHTKDGITFHRFPNNDSEIRDLWIRATNKPNFLPNKYSVVCSRHFTPDCFEALKNNRRRLFKLSVPTLYLDNLTYPVETILTIHEDSPFMEQFRKPIGSTKNPVSKPRDEESDSSYAGGGGIDSSGEYSDFDDEQAEREAGGGGEGEGDVPPEYQIEVDQSESNYDVCKMEIVEHTFSDSEDKSNFVPATVDNSPEVNMFAVVEYITKNEKELKLLDYPLLKTLTKNNPSVVTSPLVVQCSNTTYRLRATVSFRKESTHMCEVEYDTHTDTVTESECVCGNNPCQHIVAFLMWLANKHANMKEASTSKPTEKKTGTGQKAKKSQATDPVKETKLPAPADVGPSTSNTVASTLSTEDSPPAKRQRVSPEPELDAPPSTSDTAITVVSLPKDEDEPDKSKIECTFPRRTIYNMWRNGSGTVPERSQQIQSTLRAQLQDDDFITEFTPLDQRIEHLCVLFEMRQDELHLPEYSEFLDIRETLELVRRYNREKRDPLS